MRAYGLWSSLLSFQERSFWILFNCEMRFAGPRRAARVGPLRSRSHLITFVALFLSYGYRDVLYKQQSTKGPVHNR